MLSAAIFATFALVSSVVVAQPSPLTPGVANEGDDCVISWTPDATGDWTETNIQLMTGDNINMLHITTIGTVDTTSAAPATFSWPCPAVEPNSAIYFYQFSTASDPTNLQWTTRFAIAGPNGELVEPANDIQPDATNSAIPWGVGALANPASAKAAPAYITGQGVSNGSQGTGSASATVVPSATGAATGSATGSATGVATTPIAASTGTASRLVASSSRVSTGSSTRSSAAASATQSSNSGMINAPSSAFGAILGAIAFGMVAWA